jgi:hypothetical protein
MRLVPASVCWRFAGGRIVNLHHGLLPAFPGARPYHDAYSHRMLTYGATVHFIVPELDAGDQIIHQDTFTVPPGTPLTDIIRRGERDHEPRCLVEGLRRVVDREVELHYHKVITAARPPRPDPAAQPGLPGSVSATAEARIQTRCPERPSPRLESAFSLPTSRGGLGSYLLAWTVPLSFCSGVFALAVLSRYGVAVPRWFALAYGAGCVVLALLALLLSRQWQQLRAARLPLKRKK